MDHEEGKQNLRRRLCQLSNLHGLQAREGFCAPQCEEGFPYAGIEDQMNLRVVPS